MKKFIALLLAVMMMSTVAVAAPNGILLTALAEEPAIENHFTYGNGTITANFASTESKDLYFAVYNNDSDVSNLEHVQLTPNVSAVDGIVSATLNLSDVTRGANNIVKAFCWSTDGNLRPHCSPLELSYIPYTVSFSSSMGVAPSTVGVAPNGSTTLPEMENVGSNKLVGWSLDGTTYEPGAAYTVTKDVTFEAVWEQAAIEEFWIDHIGDTSTKLGDGIVFTATENTIYTYNSSKFTERCRIETGSVTIKVNLLEGESGIYDLYLYNKSNSSSRKGIVTIGGEKIGEVETVFESSTLEGRPEIKGPVSVELVEGENQIVITSSDAKQYDFYGFKLVKSAKNFVKFTTEKGTAPEEMVVGADETITLPEMENIGLSKLVGWSLNGTTYEPGASYKVTNSVTFEAVWEQAPIEEFWIDHIGDTSTKLGDGIVFTATENTIYTYNSSKFTERCRIETGSVTIKVNLLEGESGIYDLYLYNKSNSSSRKGIVTIGGEKIGEVETVFESSTLEGRPEIKGPVSVELVEGENQIVITSSDAKQYDFYGFKLVKVIKNTVSFTTSKGTAPEEMIVGEDEEITLPAMEDIGLSKFVGWSLDGTTYEAGTTYTVTEDVTFEAVWEQTPIEEFWTDHMGDTSTKLGDGVVFTATENTIAKYNGEKYIAQCRITTGSVTIKVNLLEGEGGTYDLYLYNKANKGTTKGVVTIGGVEIGTVPTYFESSTSATIPAAEGPVSVELVEGENQIVITSSTGNQYDFCGFKLVKAE